MPMYYYITFAFSGIAYVFISVRIIQLNRKRKHREFVRRVRSYLN